MQKDDVIVINGNKRDTEKGNAGVTMIDGEHKNIDLEKD